MENRTAISALFLVVLLLSPLALPARPVAAAVQSPQSPSRVLSPLQIGSEATTLATIRLVAYPWGADLTDAQLTFALTQGAGWVFNGSVLSIMAAQYPVEVNISLFPGHVYRTVEISRPLSNISVEVNASRVSVTGLVDGGVSSGESVSVFGNGSVTVASFPRVGQDQVFYLPQGSYLVTATTGTATQTDSILSETGKTSSVVFDFQAAPEGGYGLWDSLLLASGLAGAVLSVVVWFRVYKRRSSSQSAEVRT